MLFGSYPTSTSPLSKIKETPPTPGSGPGPGSFSAVIPTDWCWAAKGTAECRVAAAGRTSCGCCGTGRIAAAPLVTRPTWRRRSRDIAGRAGVGRSHRPCTPCRRARTNTRNTARNTARKRWTRGIESERNVAATSCLRYRSERFARDACKSFRGLAQPRRGSSTTSENSLFYLFKYFTCVRIQQKLG